MNNFVFLNQIMNKIFKIIFSYTVVFLLAACSHASPPAPQIIIPFSMSKAGNTVMFDFLAQPENVDIRKTYMLSLIFERTEGHDLVAMLDQHPPEAPPLVNIEIQRTDDEKQMPIEAQDCNVSLTEDEKNKIQKTIPADLKNICRPTLYRSNTTQGEILITTFYIKTYGHYQVKIKTLQDSPTFGNIKSWLAVTQYYPGE